MTKPVTLRHECWPLAAPFVISRGSKTDAHVIVVEVTDGAHRGRGEAVPYVHYGESTDSVIASLQPLAEAHELPSREQLQDLLPAGAARNAMDCALWDMEAKHAGRTAAQLIAAGIDNGSGDDQSKPALFETAFTLSLATPAEMAAQAAAAGQYPLLKLKLGAQGDEERMTLVRAARPDARLIVDANEAWLPGQLQSLFEAAVAATIELIEQPLPAGNDSALASIHRCVPVCADESAHVSADLAALQDRYDAVNIKLDKTGGLTEALAMGQLASSLGLQIMIGCMVSTSLAMAPALVLAMTLGPAVRWIDLDGPLLLARDREPGLRYDGALIHPPEPALWG